MKYLGFLKTLNAEPFWLVESLFWKTSADLDDLMIGMNQLARFKIN